MQIICSGKFVKLNKEAKQDERCFEMESPTGKQKSYCSRWAGQCKGTGDVAVLNWVQMKKHLDNQKTQIEKPGKEITSGAS